MICKLRLTYVDVWPTEAGALDRAERRTDTKVRAHNRCCNHRLQVAGLAKVVPCLTAPSYTVIFGIEAEIEHWWRGSKTETLYIRPELALVAGLHTRLRNEEAFYSIMTGAVALQQRKRIESMMCLLDGAVAMMAIKQHQTEERPVAHDYPAEHLDSQPVKTGDEAAQRQIPYTSRLISDAERLVEVLLEWPALPLSSLDEMESR